MARERQHLTPAEAAAKGWRCKTHLKADRLMPKPDATPSGTVWQGQGAYPVYALEDTTAWVYTPSPSIVRRRAVSAEASELLGGKLAVIDLETTGVCSESQICEISIIDSDGVVLLDTLVRPTLPIPQDATNINGITNEMVAAAPTWPEIAERYEAIIVDRSVVTYNRSFDERLMQQTYSAHGLKAQQWSPGACAMRLFAAWNGEWDSKRDSWRWLKLGDAAATCGVLVPGAHRALPDTQMALGILKFLQRHRSGRKPSPGKRQIS